jgi:hypothetical protein
MALADSTARKQVDWHCPAIDDPFDGEANVPREMAFDK